MVRKKGSAVVGAVRDQVDYLKRASRHNAWGIKVAFEEPVGGFAQSEEIVVSVFIPYCESGAEWEVVVDGDAPERCPDLVPLPATEADASKGFTPNMHEAYSLYRLRSLESLKKWDLFRRPGSLAALALDIKNLRRKYEIHKLENSPLSSAAKFHLEFLGDRLGEVEILVSRAGVRMAFPLWADPAATRAGEGGEGDGAETGGGGAARARQADDEGPTFVYGRAGIRLRMDWAQADGNRPDVRVVFPQEAHGLSRGFRQLPWNSDTMLSDYLPQVQAAVVRSWLARKKLVATLALRHSVLEYDAQDFTMIHLFMKVKVDNLDHQKILRVDIGPDFPEFPPQLTLCDALSELSRPLDRRNYLFSPRWDAERMATELYAHAVEAMSKPASLVLASLSAVVAVLLPFETISRVGLFPQKLMYVFLASWFYIVFTPLRLQEIQRHFAGRKPWPASLHGGFANVCPEDGEEALAWMASGAVGFLNGAAMVPLVPICRVFKGLVLAAERAAEADENLRELIAWCAFMTEVLLQHGKEENALGRVMEPLNAFVSTTNQLAGRDIAKVPQNAPDLPPAFVERSELVDSGVKDLVATDRATDEAHVLRGIPGGGKTVAAYSVVRCDKVRRIFRDGTFWVKVGQVGTGNPTALLTDSADDLAHAPSIRPHTVLHEFRDAEHVIGHLVGVLEQGNLRCLGKYAEAEQLYERCQEEDEKVLGPDHRSLATTLHNRAGLSKQQGTYAEAEPLFERSQAIREKVLGPEHPNVASSLHNYAMLLENQGKYAESLWFRTCGTNPNNFANDFESNVKFESQYG
eukprot:g8365.t1